MRREYFGLYLFAIIQQALPTILVVFIWQDKVMKPLTQCIMSGFDGWEKVVQIIVNVSSE